MTGMMSVSGVGAHDDRAGVHAPLSRQSLQAERILDDLVRVRVLLVELTELRGLGVAFVLLVEDAVDRDVLAHDRRGSALVSCSPTLKSLPRIRAESFRACLVLIVP